MSGSNPNPDFSLGSYSDIKIFNIDEHYRFIGVKTIYINKNSKPYTLMK